MRERGTFGLSGAQATADLAKAARHDDYSFKVCARPQVPLLADCIAEPSASSPVVRMLEALPRQEAEFYSREEHVLETHNKHKVISEELQSRYGFV